MDKALLWPLITQVGLTFFVALMTLKARVTASKKGEVKLSYFKHNQGQAPQAMLRWGDNLQNQFELPVLFYTLVVLLIVSQQSSTLLIALAWVFALSRIVHTFIHVYSNHILHRMLSFIAGFSALFIMWIVFSLQLMNN